MDTEQREELRQQSGPAIESVGEDGTVEVRLADGTRRAMRVPREQVELLRRAVYGMVLSR